MGYHLHSNHTWDCSEHNFSVSLRMHLPKSHKRAGQLHEAHMYFDDRLQHRFDNCVMRQYCTCSESTGVFKSLVSENKPLSFHCKFHYYDHLVASKFNGKVKIGYSGHS